MKKFWLGTAALMAMGAAANAADLPPRPYTEAPAYISPIYNWSGFYAGAMGGYAWSETVSVRVANLKNVIGGFGGGQIGYNWQFGGPWLLGLEVDAASSDIQGYSRLIPGQGRSGNKISSLGNVTGRFGWTTGPALLYVKGGWAWANNSLTALIPGGTISEGHLHSGWTIGAGFEYMFAQAWSAKAEYMYADYGEKNYFATYDLRTNLHTIKAGINYHFN